MWTTINIGVNPHHLVLLLHDQQGVYIVHGQAGFQSKFELWHSVSTAIKLRRKLKIHFASIPHGEWRLHSQYLPLRTTIIAVSKHHWIRFSLHYGW